VKLIFGTEDGFLTPGSCPTAPAVLVAVLEEAAAATLLVLVLVPITNGSLDGIGFPNLVCSFTTF